MRPVVGVSALSFLQCFDAGGWVSERSVCLLKICATYPKGSPEKKQRNKTERDQLTEVYVKNCS